MNQNEFVATVIALIAMVIVCFMLLFYVSPNLEKKHLTVHEECHIIVSTKTK